jgi:pterin-4a-carbinolamine dehydratase
MEKASSVAAMMRTAKWIQVDKQRLVAAFGHVGGWLTCNVKRSQTFQIDRKRVFSQQPPDPFARRPTQRCDPYGQGGKPLSLVDSRDLMRTLNENWRLDMDGDNIPKALVCEYKHRDFAGASAFISKIAPVGDMNNHYPKISLQRKLCSREMRWEVTTLVQCHTPTLGGLSRNDFLIAMLVDVEAERPEVRQYLLSDEITASRF